MGNHPRLCVGLVRKIHGVATRRRRKCGHRVDLRYSAPYLVLVSAVLVIQNVAGTDSRGIRTERNISHFIATDPVVALVVRVSRVSCVRCIDLLTRIIFGTLQILG